MLGVNWRIGLPPLGIAASIFTLLDLVRSDGDNSEAINYRQLYGPRELPSAPPPRFNFGPRWLTVHECSRPQSAQPISGCPDQVCRWRAQSAGVATRHRIGCSATRAAARQACAWVSIRPTCFGARERGAQ